MRMPRSVAAAALALATAAALASSAAAQAPPGDAELCRVVAAAVRAGDADFASLRGPPIAEGKAFSASNAPFSGDGPVRCSIVPATPTFGAQFACQVRTLDINTVEASVGRCLPGWRRVYDPPANDRGLMFDYFSPGGPGAESVTILPRPQFVLVVVVDPERK